MTFFLLKLEMQEKKEQEKKIIARFYMALTSANDPIAVDFLTAIVSSVIKELDSHPTLLDYVLQNYHTYIKILLNYPQYNDKIYVDTIDLFQRLISKGNTQLAKEMMYILGLDLMKGEKINIAYFKYGNSDPYTKAEAVKGTTFILDPTLKTFGSKELIVMMMNKYNVFMTIKNYLGSNPDYNKAHDVCTLLESTAHLINPDYVNYIMESIAQNMAIPNLRVLRMLITVLGEENPDYDNYLQMYLEGLESCGHVIVNEVANLIDIEEKNTSFVQLVISCVCEQFLEEADNNNNVFELCKVIKYLNDSSLINPSLIIEKVHGKWAAYQVAFEAILPICTQEIMTNFLDDESCSTDKTMFISQLLLESEETFEVNTQQLVKLCEKCTQSDRENLLKLVESGKFNNQFIEAVKILYQEAEERELRYPQIIFILEASKLLGIENFNSTELTNAVLFTADSTLIIKFLLQYPFLKVSDPTLLLSLSAQTSSLFKYLEDNFMNSFPEYESEIILEEGMNEEYAALYLKAYKMFNDKQYLWKSFCAHQTEESISIVKSLIKENESDKEELESLKQIYDESIFKCLQEENKQSTEDISPIEKLNSLKECANINENIADIVKNVEDTKENAETLLEMYLDASFPYQFHTHEFCLALLSRLYKYPDVLSDALDETTNLNATSLRPGLSTVREKHANAFLQAFSAFPEITKSLLLSYDDISKKAGKLLALLSLSKKEFIDPTKYFPEHFFDSNDKSFAKLLRKLSSNLMETFQFSIECETFTSNSSQSNIDNNIAKYISGSGSIQEDLNNSCFITKSNNCVDSTKFYTNLPTALMIRVTKEKEAEIPETLEFNDITNKRTRYQLVSTILINNAKASTYINSNNTCIKCADAECVEVGTMPKMIKDGFLLYGKEGSCFSYEGIWSIIPEDVKNEILNKDQLMGTLVNSISDWSSFTKNEGFFSLVIKVAAKENNYRPLLSLANSVEFSEYFFQNSIQFTEPGIYKTQKELIASLARIYPNQDELFETCDALIDTDIENANLVLLIISEINVEPDKLFDTALRIAEIDQLSLTDDFTKIIHKLIDANIDAVSIIVNIPQIRQKLFKEGDRKILPFIQISEDIIEELKKFASSNYCFEILGNTDDIKIIKESIPLIAKEESVLSFFPKIRTNEEFFISEPNWISSLITSESPKVRKESINLLKSMWPPEKQEASNTKLAMILSSAVNKLLRLNASSEALEVLKNYDHIFTRDNNSSISIFNYCFSSFIGINENTRELYEYIGKFAPESFLIQKGPDLYYLCKRNFIHGAPSFSETIIMFLFLFYNSPELTKRTLDTESFVKLIGMCGKYSVSESFVEDWLVPQTKKIINKFNLSPIINLTENVRTTIPVLAYLIDFIASIPYLYDDTSFICASIINYAVFQFTDMKDKRTAHFISVMADILDSYDASVPFTLSYRNINPREQLMLGKTLFVPFLISQITVEKEEDELQAALLKYCSSLFKIIPQTIELFLDQANELIPCIKGLNSVNQFITTTIKAFRMALSDTSIIPNAQSSKLGNAVYTLQNVIKLAFDKEQCSPETLHLIVAMLTACFTSKTIVPFFDVFLKNGNVLNILKLMPDNKDLASEINKMIFYSLNIDKVIHCEKVLELAKSIERGEKKESLSSCCRILCTILKKGKSESLTESKPEIIRILKEVSNTLTDESTKKLINGLN